MPELSTVLFVLLWQAGWQSSLLLIGGLALAHRVREARQRSRLLHLAIVFSLLAPVASHLLPHWIALPNTLPAWVPLVDAPLGSELQWPAANWFATGVIAIWLTGCAIQVARIVAGWVAIRRVLAMSAVLQNERVDRLLRRIGSPPDIQLRLLPGLAAPFCWQIQQPVIVLPTNLLQRNDEELELLLRHEIAHLQFGDPLKLFLEQVVLAVLWPHPLLRHVNRAAQRWREIACDDRAIAAGGSPRRLAVLLTELAEQAARRPLGAWGLSSMGAGNDLPVRVLWLLTPPNRYIMRSAISRVAPAILTGVAIVLMTVRLGGPWSEHPDQRWLYWPPASGQLLDLVGIQVVDYDLLRVEHDPREQSSQHRAAHQRVGRTVND